MTKKSYKKKSEVAHHGSKATRKDVAATFKRFLALLATFGSFQATQQFFEFINIKVIAFGTSLSFG